jgi:mono/diheme cytochrome c family protein
MKLGPWFDWLNTTLRIASRLAVTILPVGAYPNAKAADVSEGRTLAQTVCGKCHEVVSSGTGWTSAPSFAAIANKPTTTMASLEAIIQAPHPKMSPGATRSPSEAADLAAYILSLKH